MQLRPTHFTPYYNALLLEPERSTNTVFLQYSRCKQVETIVETNMSSPLVDELAASHEPAIKKHRVTHSDFDKGLRVHWSLGNLVRLFKIDPQRHVGLYLSSL